MVLGTGLSSLMVPPGDLSLSTRSSLFRRGVSFPKALVRCASWWIYRSWCRHRIERASPPAWVRHRIRMAVARLTRYIGSPPRQEIGLANHLGTSRESIRKAGLPCANIL